MDIQLTETEFIIFMIWFSGYFIVFIPLTEYTADKKYSDIVSYIRVTVLQMIIMGNGFPMLLAIMIALLDLPNIFPKLDRKILNKKSV